MKKKYVNGFEVYHSEAGEKELLSEVKHNYRKEQFKNFISNVGTGLQTLAHKAHEMQEHANKQNKKNNNPMNNIFGMPNYDRRRKR